jgi:FMN-dependent oxidoreductase (nitrilotriacetate monooxygenase family)
VFHLGWFLSYQVQSWRGQFSGAGMTEWVKPDLYVDVANSLERAGFDYLMFEDGMFVPDSYGSSPDYYLRNAAMAPKHDPLTLIPAIAQRTKNIGFIATVTTTFYPPYLAARMMTSLDHITEGRVGLNLVTSHNVRTAQNFGLKEQIQHADRYAMANEWIDVVSQLWDSWEPDALVLDADGGQYADASKVHTIDHEGRFFSSRGPLNTIPGPQRRPVVCQAGGSPDGRDFGARHADTIVAQVRTPEQMKEYREDISRRALEHGRKPSDIKILFITSFVVSDSDRHAQELVDAMDADEAANIEGNLLAMSYSTGLDFSKFDLDGPVPDITTNNAKATTKMMLEGEPGATLRDIARRPPAALRFHGTPDSIAAQMEECMSVAGGDGFLVSGEVNRRHVAEVADGIAPALRKRGLIRSGYDGPTFRDNLLAY